MSEQTAPDSPNRAESEAEAADRLLHGSSFGAAAAAYAEHRPGYAEAAVRWALEPVRDRQPVRVADIGAGTGKLTATLAGLGAEVTAVEPDPQMLAELRRAMPAVRSVPGSAEQIPLPDASLDAVLAGQAMHWFDMDRALPEIARVLRPGGVLAGLWNVDDDRVGWVAGLAEISKRKSSITLTRWRDGEAQSRQERLLGAGSDLFAAAEVGEFGHGRPAPPIRCWPPSARTLTSWSWRRPNGPGCSPGPATSCAASRRPRTASSRCRWSPWCCERGAARRITAARPDEGWVSHKRGHQSS